MKLYFGADHGGFALKNFLLQYFKELGIECSDSGAYNLQAEDDFPLFAGPVARAVAADREGLGVLCCRSGQGMSIAANKVPGARAVLGWNPQSARKGRFEDHANVICLPADFLDEEKALEIVQEFVNALPSTEKKHLRRVREISEIEKAQGNRKSSKS